MIYSLFFFNDTATPEIYTLSLHDALPISSCAVYVRQARTGTRDARSACAAADSARAATTRSEEHTFELQSHSDLVCRLLLEKKKKKKIKKKRVIRMNDKNNEHTIN